MKIAIISSLFASVPPKGYGGAEAMIYNLVEGLVRRGHNVTLFASGDSETSAHLISVCPKAFWNDKSVEFPSAYISLMLGKVFERWREFDLIQDNLGDQNILPFSKHIKIPVVLTLWGEITPERKALYMEYSNCYYISISNSQRRQAPELNYVATIHGGIEVSNFTFNKTPKNYLLFLGEISRRKGVDIAIKVAKKTRARLIIAGKIYDRTSGKTQGEESSYFVNEIKPYIDGTQIKYIGEVGYREKVKLLKNAKALLFPIRWEEPFGLVMIEAMACGTPVIAFNRGAVPEVLVDKKTGFIVNTVDEMVEAVKKISKIDRAKCREHVERNFTAKKMVSMYEEVYKKILNLKRNRF